MANDGWLETIVNLLDGSAVAYETGMTTGELNEYGTKTVDGAVTTVTGSQLQTF